MTEQYSPVEKQELAARIYWSLPIDRRTWEAAELILRRDYGIKGGPRNAKILGDTWESIGRVSHLVLNHDLSGDIPQRNPKLEKQFLQYFSPRHIMVINTDGEVASNTSSNGSSRPERTIDSDNWIHRGLGAWASSLLLAYLRPGDTLGAGPGRGPLYTARAAEARVSKEQPALKSIISLCGSMSQTNPSQKIIDADQVATALRNIPLFAQGIFLTNCSIIPDKMRVVGPRHLSPKLWPRFIPQIALIGIGALAGSHRVLAIQQGQLEFGEAHADFMAVVSLAHQIDAVVNQTDPCYHCVGDLCNHFFQISLPAKTDSGTRKKIDSLLTKLSKAVERVNRKTYTARPAYFEDIATSGAVIAVAGGENKRHAINHVLNQPRPWITHLVTDSATARWLIEQAEHRRPTNRGEV